MAAEVAGGTHAMTTAEFVAWMNAQFQKHGAAKVIPSDDLALDQVSEHIAATLLDHATEEVSDERYEEMEELLTQLQTLDDEIAEEARVRANQRFEEVKLPTGADAVKKIKAWLKKHDHSHWRNSIKAVASKFIARAD
jgi:hypothetical protein